MVLLTAEYSTVWQTLFSPPTPIIYSNSHFSTCFAVSQTAVSINFKIKIATATYALGCVLRWERGGGGDGDGLGLW